MECAVSFNSFRSMRLLSLIRRVRVGIAGRVAQLVRAPRLHRGGPGFESLRAHHSPHFLVILTPPRGAVSIDDQDAFVPSLIGQNQVAGAQPQWMTISTRWTVPRLWLR